MDSLSHEYEQLMFKIVLVGDSQVGKTAFIHRFVESSFHTGAMATVGVSWSTKHMSWEGQAVKLQIWDTAGQERFSGLAPLYCRKADAVLLFYDITNLESFHNVKNWLEKANIPIFSELILVGHKIDLCRSRVVTTAMGQKKAEGLRPGGVHFFEASAKTDTKIDDIFYCIVSHLLSVEGNGRSPQDNVTLDYNQPLLQGQRKPACCSTTS